MKKWLQTQYKKLLHRCTWWIYQRCLATMRKLRVYHRNEIITKANSKDGFLWNGILLLGIQQHTQENLYVVTYCIPNGTIGVALVDMDDLVSGTAELPQHKSRARNVKATIEDIATKKLGNGSAGIVPIGELWFDPTDGPDGKMGPEEIDQLLLELDDTTKSNKTVNT
jgi:hypothetical protein